jgi:hypothetical protein
MSTLATTLFSELTPKFFGVLTGPNAAIYIDVLDLIERELPARGDSLQRDEVIELIERVLTQGRTFHPDEEDEAHEDDSHPASRVLKRLISANWLGRVFKLTQGRRRSLTALARYLLDFVHFYNRKGAQDSR